MIVAKSSGVTARDCVSNSAMKSLGSSPGSVRICTASALSTASMTRIRSSEVLRLILKTFSSWLLEETAMIRIPESFRTNAVWSAVCVEYIGTVTAPRASAAKSVIVHSGRFSLRIPTRSPFRIPQAARARDKRTTRRCNSAAEIARHPDPSFCIMTRARLLWLTLSRISFSVRMLI